MSCLTQMIDLKIPLNIEPAAIGILQEHCNGVLLQALKIVKRALQKDQVDPDNNFSEKFFPFGTPFDKRWEMYKNCEETLKANKTHYFVYIEVFYILKLALKELEKDFDLKLDGYLSNGNTEEAAKLINRFHVSSDISRSFIKNALYNSNTWDRKVFHYLNRLNDQKSQFILNNNDDANMLRFETPYFFIDLFLTKGMEEILDKKMKDSDILASLFEEEDRDSALIIGQI